MTDVIKIFDELVAKREAAPPTWWQNKFHSERDVVFGNGEVNKAGEWWSPNLYATRALAEEAAENDMMAYAGWVKANGIRWLGTFPAKRKAGGEA